MSVKSQAQQRVGFSIGATATTPDYLIPGRSFNDEPSEIRDTLEMTFGSNDNRYANPITGYEDNSVPITMPVDEKIFPILFASFFKSETTTGTTPNFVNSLVPAGTGEERRISFFVEDGANGIIKYEGAIGNQVVITGEQNQINAEFTFVGATRTVLSGTALTNAQTQFDTLKTNLATEISNLTTSLGRTATIEDYYMRQRPGWATVEYGEDYTFASSTVINVDFGFTLTITNEPAGNTQTLSASGDLVQPTKYYGSFGAGLTFDIKTSSNDLKNRADTNQATNFRVLIGDPNRTNRYFDFKFNATEFVVESQERVGDSNELVMQSITIEKANNTVDNPSFRTLIGSEIDLPTLF